MIFAVVVLVFVVSALADAPATRGLLADPRDRRVVRYAFGATLAMAVAMGFAWELSFVVPILSLALLASPGPRPSIRKSVGFVVWELLRSTEFPRIPQRRKMVRRLNW